MKGKSKFIAFILSAIPGLSHLYIGLRDRALLFIMITLGAFMGTVGLGILMGQEEVTFLFIFAYPIIWLIALVDVFYILKKIQLSQLYNNDGIDYDYMTESKINKKTITLSLSIIPGAGHMYLGYQKKGLLIMAGFFFSVFFMGWLGISLLLFTLPLIWFYSFFDALHIVDGTKEEIIDEQFILPKVKPEWIGYGLIGLGVIIIIERMIYPLISYDIRRYIQTSIVSLIFIIGGIYILNKNKNTKVQIDEEEKNDENI